MGRPADKPLMSSIGSAISSASLSSAVNSGLATIASGSQMLNQDAEQIADPVNQNVTAPLAGLNQASVLAEAGAEVISAANQMLGTLLDVFA
jgi:hypothetical protein